MTLELVFVRLHNPQTRVCPLRASHLPWWHHSTYAYVIHLGFIFASAWLLVLPSVFTTLRPKSVHCVLKLCLGDNHRHCRLSSQPLDWSLSVVCQDLGFLSTTLSVVIHFLSPQIGVCPLRAEVSSWLQPLASPSGTSQESSLCLTRLSALLSVFTALRSESVCYVLRLLFCLTRPSV